MDQDNGKDAPVREKAVPTLGPRDLVFVNLYEDSEELQIAEKPVGWIRAGSLRFDVHCMTPDQRAELRGLLGEDTTRFYDVVQDASHPAFTRAAFYALGEKVPEKQIPVLPPLLLQAVREAVTVYFWGGLVSGRSTTSLRDSSSATTGPSGGPGRGAPGPRPRSSDSSIEPLPAGSEVDP